VKSTHGGLGLRSSLGLRSRLRRRLLGGLDLLVGLLVTVDDLLRGSLLLLEEQGSATTREYERINRRTAGAFFASLAGE